MSATVWIVDDSDDVRELLSMVLRESGHQVAEFVDGAGLLGRFSDPAPDVILLDLKLPDADGLKLLPQIKGHWPETEVIMLTGYASLDGAVQATKLGAYDFQKKPFDPKALVISVDRAVEHKSLSSQNRVLRQAVATLSNTGSAAVFQSPGMKSVVRMVERVAPSDVSVLITGESGTGKEVIADLIHAQSTRNKGPFIKVNCAALPRELIESELFGSMRGAFTGSQADREGLFKQANNGTLLLDELAEMPVDTQSKLLRVLQDKEFRPVGGKTVVKTDCRVIAATNVRTEEAIKAGKLREDLFYRISAITIALPALRERREDVLPLARAFLKRFAAQAGANITGFSPAAEQKLQDFDWPGNVRQLQNEVQRAVLMCDGPLVEEWLLSIRSFPGSGVAVNSLGLLDEIKRKAILKTLEETAGNKLETARRLGIGRQTLYNKIKAYGIDPS